MPLAFWKTYQQPLPNGKFSALLPEKIVDTMSRLENRIGERFPDSGLRQVAVELTEQARATQRAVKYLPRPIWIIRIAALLAIALVLTGVITMVSLTLDLDTGADGWVEWVQAIESAINELIFLAIALYFLVSLEMRVKRKIALAALHRLRSFAHVIDMHQLTKDPASILATAQPTASSPQRAMTPFELVRYLDYCTELLSLTSKIGALYAQDLNDPIVLNAVNDVESLVDGLSAKIWQKIMILDMAVPDEEQEGPLAENVPEG